MAKKENHNLKWTQIWKEFNEWFDNNFDPVWERQQRKIKALVKKYLLKNTKP